MTGLFCRPKEARERMSLNWIEDEPTSHKVHTSFLLQCTYETKKAKNSKKNMTDADIS